MGVKVRWFNFHRWWLPPPGAAMHWSTPRLRLLVGCGAAAGIASAYNAPIAGALFVAEIVLGSVAMEIFGPLVFSSVVATLTVRGFLGGDPLYEIPPFRLNTNSEIIPYLLLGVVAGLIAPWFIRLLRASEQLAARIHAPVYVKMCAGGLIVGALAIIHPEVCGNGYSAVNAILRGQWLWETLAVILVFKVLATSATLAPARLAVFLHRRFLSAPALDFCSVTACPTCRDISSRIRALSRSLGWARSSLPPPTRPSWPSS